MKESLQEFVIKADLLQAIINNLETQPAREVRQLLNAIEAFVIEQNNAFQAEAEETKE